MQATRPREGFELTAEGREALRPSCLKCPHFKSCDIFKSTARFLAGAYPDLPDGTKTAPFKADEIARVCSFYVPPGAAGITA